MSETPTNPAQAVRPDAASFFAPGSIADRVELQLGVLTQGVVDCMVLATGAYPGLTEGPPEQPNAIAKSRAQPTSSWQATRSAELRDAARLTEASARLISGFAKLRGQFSHDYTIRHSDRRAGAKTRQRNTTIVKRFSVPASEAVDAISADPRTAAELTRGLANVAQGLSMPTPAQRENRDETIVKLMRRLGRSQDEIDALLEARAAKAMGETPPPTQGT